LRVAVIASGGGFAVHADVRGRLPGRGASLHPDLRCLDLAERRRSFPRAFRLPGPLDTSALRAYLEERVEHDQRSTPAPAEAGPDAGR
jgi:predicted RNA-binding protein YlxR (DUF448 family)